MFVFYEGTTAAGIALKDEKFGMLYGKHIRALIRRRTGLNRFQGITHGIWAKGCYTEIRRGQEFDTEHIQKNKIRLIGIFSSAAQSKE